MDNLEVKTAKWIEQGLNVYWEGRHGVGKTSIIRDAFNKAGIKWKYFSGSTIDPYPEFIGIPRPGVGKGKNSEIITYARPEWHFEGIQAIFIDEYNRAKPQIMNAAMELVQFKSINGQKFPDLKMVWVAGNPEDDLELNFHVEAIDPAQKDRFHVHVYLPYELNENYFTERYGADTSDILLKWWATHDPKVQLKMSPRRVDYAMEQFRNGVDLKDILPPGANVNSLATQLQNGSYYDKMVAIAKAGNEKEIKKFINNNTNFANCKTFLVKDKQLLRTYVDHIKPEHKALLLSEGGVFDYFRQNPKDFGDIPEQVKSTKSGTWSQIINTTLSEGSYTKLPTDFNRKHTVKWTKEPKNGAINLVNDREVMLDSTIRVSMMNEILENYDFNGSTDKNEYLKVFSALLNCVQWSVYTELNIPDLQAVVPVGFSKLIDFGFDMNQTSFPIHALKLSKLLIHVIPSAVTKV